MTTAANPPSEGSVRARFEVRASEVDAAVWRAFARHLAPVFPAGLAVLAVGGYGRRELFPCSDVDLLLLVDREPAAQAHRGAITAFLQELWDAGHRLSHSVRTPAECCEVHQGNLELNISLLDQRFAAGDAALHERLGAALPRFFHAERHHLARHLCDLAHERHARHAGSIYQLEPNIKESPGGIRDYHLVRWLSQLQNTHPQHMPAPGGFPALDGAREFLFAARFCLHTRAGRDHNVLTFEAQEDIAGADPAPWMRDYYRHARAVYSAAERAMEAVDERVSSLLVQFRDWRSRVSNQEFFVSRERVFFRAPARLAAEPELALRLFEFVGRHGFRLAEDTERRVRERLPDMREYFSVPRPVWPAFSRVLAGPHAVEALRAMHESGLLGALFPEWEAVECLPVRDFYHRYTVDEHSLRAIQALVEIAKSPDPGAGRFADLFSEIDDAGVLFFALLFHDAGKIVPGHVGESVRLAGRAMERIGMPEAERRVVRTLIAQHLELSKAMNSRDLDDPATARNVAESTGTLEVLKRLTLMTYADISAVNPGAMTPWKREQLWRVYTAAHTELTRELDADRIADPAHASARGGELQFAGLGEPAVAEFLDGLPVRYLRVFGPAEIRAHAALELQARTRGAAIHLDKSNGVYRLTLVARDRPFLLASVAGALAGFGMNILKAEGYANRRQTVLDCFSFSDPLRTLELNPTEVERLKLTLERVATGKLDAATLLKNRPQPVLPSRGARVAPTITFDTKTSDSATLIHVTAQDRPGLLYELARAISTAGCNVDLALVDTEAHKALDVFYVTAGGGKLDAARQESLRAAVLAACLK